MTLPGFSAESSLYRSAVHYHTLAALVGTAEPIRFQELGTSGSADCRDGLCELGRAEVPGCSMRADGSRLIHAFRTRVGDLNVIGEGSADTRGPGKHLSMTIDRAGVPLLNFDGTLSGAGVYTATWRYGAMVGGVREATLVTRDGNRIEGTVNGRQLTPFTARASSLRFTDGTPVPQPNFPIGLAPALEQVPRALQAALGTCSRSVFTPRGAIVPASNGGTSTFGSPPRIDDPGSSSNCHDCILEAYGAAALCGAACGFSFGLACACVAGIPVVFIRCHTPGTGFGQGCCPVLCGPTQNMLGADISYQCCSDGDSCLNSSKGTCCGPGLQACNKSTCCPSNAPCRDPGICCPTNQNTCITPSGPVCCNAGEQCIQGVCCPTGSTVCSDGSCCPTTCANGSCCVSGKCCYPPSHICGNTCCPPFNACCSDVCCSGDEICAGGNCCPVGQACGNVCCPPGQSCQDPATGTCGACAPGTSPVRCENTTSGAAASACCPPNVNCCNGQCCQTASDQFGPIVCCYNVSGDIAPYNTPGFGCHHSFACTE